MPVPSIPSAAQAKKKSSKKSSADLRKGASRMSLFAAGRGKQVYEAAVPVAEFAGSALLAHTAAGFQAGRGKGMQVGYGDYTVDARLLGGLGALVFALWKSGQTNSHALNIGTGFLTSWAAEKAFVYGETMGQKVQARMAPAAPVSAEAAASEGIVIGNIFRSKEVSEARKEARESGASRKEVRQAGRSARIAKRIEKLEARREKLGGEEAAPAATASAARGGAGRAIPLAWIRPEFRAQAQAMRAARQAARQGR